MLFELIKGLIMDLDGTATDEVCLKIIIFWSFASKDTIAV